ncbi:hypothetical protein [Calothrix sp. PCC 6303]|uniref:hypothetical protein n=1 Tax=Calothrix sp. PCC 6303 TaxID=1170562 RepID=UPI0002A02400|nr:hypothetical protein [Calothrix sp. PCC 6303]AFZ01920.1 hypothetical protein Cal6303_2971 [Calothrix sp. PCC 6303]
MNLNQINPNLINLVKVVSTTVMFSAVGLELGNIYALTNSIRVPSNLDIVFVVERIAVTSHFIEAIIAGFFAPAKNKQPIQYAVYTFFTGTIGLLELLQIDKVEEKPN